MRRGWRRIIILCLSHRCATLPRAVCLVAVRGGMVLQGAVIQFVLGLIIALVTWIILRGEIEPVTGVALMGLVVLSAGPLRVLASLSTALEQSAQEINGVRTLLETPILPEPSQPIPFPDRHDIELDNVGFFYESSSKPVLDAVNLALPENSYTALVAQRIWQDYSVETCCPVMGCH